MAKLTKAELDAVASSILAQITETNFTLLIEAVTNKFLTSN